MWDTGGHWLAPCPQAPCVADLASATAEGERAGLRLGAALAAHGSTVVGGAPGGGYPSAVEPEVTLLQLPDLTVERVWSGVFAYSSLGARLAVTDLELDGVLDVAVGRPGSQVETAAYLVRGDAEGAD
jgi:hypothetical protein